MAAAKNASYDCKRQRQENDVATADSMTLPFPLQSAQKMLPLDNAAAARQCRCCSTMPLPLKHEAAAALNIIAAELTLPLPMAPS
jgi:hypothetical protein